MLDPNNGMQYVKKKKWGQEYVKQYTKLLIDVVSSYTYEQPSHEADSDEEESLQEMYRMIRANDNGARPVEQQVESVDAEVKRYLNHPKLLNEVNELKWWYTQRSNYPRVYLAARDYLAIPGTSTASERQFSSAGLVVTKQRSSMSPRTLEVVMGLKAWFKYEKSLVTGTAGAATN